MSCRIALTVASGLPACRANTLPALSTAKTPLTVPFGVFLKPIEAISVAPVSQIRGYGKFCLDLNVVFDLGESAERP